nr:transposase IS200-family protein [Kibdelosporangium sp. MJ126-NF4]CTQ98183.1 transposase IS200-family protein [Kibdelosporangium sp. MJ126-NF4]
MNSCPKERACRPTLPLRVADRLAAAVLTGCQVGRCVWTHDFAPAHNTTSRDVMCRIVVGVPNEATPATDKRRLRAPVLLVDPATAMALLRRVGGIDLHARHSRLLCLVGEVLAELGERPGVQRGPLGLAKPYPRADANEILDGDAASGAFSLGHDTFADLMVHISGEPGLLTTAFLQQPPSRGGLLGLQPLTEPMLPFAVAVQPCSGHPLTVGRGRDVHDPQIDSEESAHRLPLPCFGPVDDGVHQPHPVAAGQIGFTNHWPGAQQGEMTGVSHDPHVPESTGDSPDRHRAITTHITKLPGQTTSVERLRRLRTEHDRTGLDLPAPVRTSRPVVPSPQVGSQRRIGVHSLADHPNRRLRRQPEPLPQPGIEPLLHIKFPKHPSGVHLLRQPRRGSVTRMQGSQQRTRLLTCRQQPHPHHSLHTGHSNVDPHHRSRNPIHTHSQVSPLNAHAKNPSGRQRPGFRRRRLEFR